MVHLVTQNIFNSEIPFHCTHRRWWLAVDGFSQRAFGRIQCHLETPRGKSDRFSCHQLQSLHSVEHLSITHSPSGQLVTSSRLQLQLLHNPRLNLTKSARQLLRFKKQKNRTSAQLEEHAFFCRREEVHVRQLGLP